MTGSGDVTGVRPDGLHGTGRKIAGRSGGGQSAASGLKNNLDSSAGLVGHSRVTSAITAFVTNGVIDNSNLLGNQLTNAGDNVSNVAATARSSDEEGARALQLHVGSGVELERTVCPGIDNDRINRPV